MDIGYINGLLSEVKNNLYSLDPQNFEENRTDGVEPMQHHASEVDSDRIAAVRERMDHLMRKLYANRDDSNRVRASGTKPSRDYSGAHARTGAKDMAARSDRKIGTR